MRARLNSLIGILLIVWACQPVVTTADTEIIRIGYIGQQRERPPALSNLDEFPEDEGFSGAVLAIADNNTTGKFTGQVFELESQQLHIEQDPLTVVNAMLADGIRFFVLDLGVVGLERVVNDLPLETAALFFNSAAQDRLFRDTGCHPLLLHTAISRDMRSDALAQFLVKKRWKDWFLITGPRVEDQKFKQSILRSAKKFGAKIRAEKVWDGDFDARRLASAEVPLFTKGVDYDVLIVADEIGDFGNYLLFQTFDPRPVAGTQGLVAKAWGRPLEQWGAVQLQERFLALTNRWMKSRDYAAWLAVRAVGEAALRASSTDFADMNQYVRSGDFELAGFKGRKMNFRAWNGQLRQPVPLMWSSALVAQAPIDGFLHRRTELDTLGLDLPESRCPQAN